MDALITKLPGAVTDASLGKLDELIIDVDIVAGDSASSTRKMFVNGAYGENYKATIEGNGYFMDSTFTNNLGKELTLITGYTDFYFSPGKYKVRIPAKQNLIRFNTSTAASAAKRQLSFGNIETAMRMEYLSLNNFYKKDGLFNLKDFISESLVSLTISVNTGKEPSVEGDLEYLNPNVTSFNLQNQKISGNISSLASHTTLTSAGLYGLSAVEGSISSIGDLVSLTSLNVEYCSSLSGTLESLFDAMVTSGRTSGTLTVYYGNSPITYNGQTTTGSTPVVATFSSNGWTVS